MLNRIILEGRLGADPERRETPNGRVVARLALPLFNPYQKDNDPTEWIQCEVWNQPAEFICKNGKKGHLVSVEGRLRNQRYTDKEGATKYRTYLSVERLTLLEPKNRRENPVDAPVNTVAPVAPAPVVVPPAPVTPPVTPPVLAEGTSTIEDLFKDFDNMMGN